MISYIVTIKEGMTEKKLIKKKIGVGSVAKAEVGDIEDNKREGRMSMVRKEVVGCFQYVVGKKRF